MSVVGNNTQNNSLMDALLTLKDNTMRSTHVAEICRVVELRANSQVKITPINNSKDIWYAYNMYGLNLATGQIVLVIFTDTDNRTNLYRNASNTSTQYSTSAKTHSSDYGIIIGSSGSAGAILYNETGNNTNGSMTQAATTAELEKLNSLIKTNASNIATNASNITTKMDKVNPTGTGSLSINRKADTTIGDYSTASGTNTTASGVASTAFGGATTASGNYSFSVGADNIASGDYSVAVGHNVTANSRSQHTFGEYNVLDTNTNASSRGTYIEIVGNGTSASARSNARTLDWSGNEVLAGGLITGGSVQVGASTLIQSDVNGGMEFGRTDGTAGTPYIDFHANATTTDYDARIIASDGSGSSTGTANLNVICKAFQVNGVSVLTKSDIQYKTSSSSGSYDYYSFKIPTNTSGVYLVINSGVFYSGQDTSFTVTFLFPYSTLDYGIGVVGMKDDGQWTNGFYTSNNTKTSIQFKKRYGATWGRFNIIGIGS